MYYDPKRGYSGVNQLVKKTRYSKKKVEEFLAKQRVYTLIHTDKGLEFINKPTQNLFQKLGIHWFTTENETKAQVVERFNRTLKSKMYKYFTANNTKTWIDIIHDLIFNYNNSYHRSIKMTPVEASLEKNSKSVYDSLFPNEKIGKLKGKFKVGDRVRISKKRKDFTKGYLPNFTEEIFVILKVLETDPPTYILNDMNDEIIKGSFYEQELVKYENDAYEIDKIIKRKKDKLLVKWKGYIEPSWINKSDMM